MLQCQDSLLDQTQLLTQMKLEPLAKSERTFYSISLMRKTSVLHLLPQSCFYASRHSGWRVCIIRSIWKWVQKTCRLTEAGLIPVMVFSCYVAPRLLGLAWTSFQYKLLFYVLTMVGSVVWCSYAGPEIVLFLLSAKLKVFPDIALTGARSPDWGFGGSSPSPLLCVLQLPLC